MLREFAKDNQIINGRFISEDLLIRSNKEIQKNILPFIKILMPHSCDSSIADLSTFKRYGGAYAQNNFVSEEEARDNFFREQLIEEEFRQINRGKKGHGAAAQGASNNTMRIQLTSNYKKDDLLINEK